MTTILDQPADLAIAPITNLPLSSTDTGFVLGGLAGDISLFPDPATTSEYYCFIWKRTGNATVGDAGRVSEAERVRVTARDVPTQTLTVTRGSNPIELNVAGAEYWIVLSMHAQLIEDIDDRIFDSSGGELVTTKVVNIPTLRVSSALDVRSNAPLRLFNTGNTQSVALDAPASLLASYGLEMPDALPGGVEFLTLAPSGKIGTSLGTAPSSLDDAYNVGRIIMADGGPVEIQDAGGLQVTHTQPVVLFETTNTGPSTYNWRFVASTVDTFHLQRGDQDEDISDDAFVNAFRYDGLTRRMMLHGTPEPQDTLHIQNPLTGATRIRLQPFDGLAVSDVGVLIVDSAGASQWELGHDVSAAAFVIGRPNFTNPYLALLNTDGRAAFGKIPSAAWRLCVFNNQSGLGGVLIDQDQDQVTLRLESAAITSPLIELVPDPNNDRGDINFAARFQPASPITGDMWYNSLLQRMQFQFSGVVRDFATRYGPAYGAEVPVEIATGAITVNTGGGQYVVDGEGSASDVLESIVVVSNGVQDGDTIVLRPASGVTITVSTTLGNIRLNGNMNIALNVVNDTLLLMYRAASGQWLQLSHSNNAI